MSYETVEAIQADLEGYGLVLLPGDRENPPQCLDDTYIYLSNFRVFEKVNPNAPVFKYKRNVRDHSWRLDEN
jgi:hypothetical protein